MSKGITLVELMIVVAIIAVLSAIAGPEILKVLHNDARIRASAREYIADLKLAQAEALRQGGGEMSPSGVLVKKSLFVVFGEKNSYEIWSYTDKDGDGEEDDNGSELRQVAAKTLPAGARLGTLTGVTTRACENEAGAPSWMVTFLPKSDAPCKGAHCLELNANGFPAGSSAIGGTVYVTDDRYAYAVHINSAGLITLCKWRGGRWNVVR